MPNKSWRLAWSIVAASMVAGCATPTTRQATVSEHAKDAEAIKQTELAVQDLVEKHKRVRRLHRVLATKGTALCGDHVGPDVGMFSLTRPEKGDLGPALERLYGIGDRPTILFVLEGSPAQAAGLQARDVIVRVNDESPADLKALYELEAKLPPSAPIQYVVERNGAQLRFSVSPEPACRYPITVARGQSVNAFADGRRIMVTQGMVNFAREDNELSLVIAHEMAHNAMRHMEARHKNAGMGAMADLLILLLSRGQSTGHVFQHLGAMAYSQEFEAEADYVGLYLMANAGLPIGDAPLFWRRMAAAHPASIRTNHAASHPSTAYRMVALENAVREIRAKVAAHAPLMPNMKDGEVTVATAASAQAAEAAAPPAASSAAKATTRAPVPASAPLPAPAPAQAPVPPSTANVSQPASVDVARAAPGAVAAGSGKRASPLPAAGTTWVYDIADRMYGRKNDRVTVTVTRAAHRVVDEQLSFDSGGTLPPHSVDIGGMRFVNTGVGKSEQFVEFAPYYLLARSEGIRLPDGEIAGYPMAGGEPAWVTRLAEEPRWERVTVPAGTFRALRLHIKGRRATQAFSPIVIYTFSVKVWYAPEVNRYVRLEREEWFATSKASYTVAQLVKVKPPS